MKVYRLRECRPEDEPALLDLFLLVFGHRRSAREWQWKFVASRQLCAAGDGAVAESMVAVDERDEIVAHAGALTLPGWSFGGPIPIVQVCDVMVHPDHRGGVGRNNLFTLLLRELLERIRADLPRAFRYGFPGRRPYLLGDRARVYERMEIAVEMDVPSRVASRFGLWKAGPLTWEDPRLDRLWLRLRGQYQLGLVRDGAYLRWRYADNPTHRYRLVGLWFLGRLSGWVVVRAADGVALLVDVLVPRWGCKAGLEVAATEGGGGSAGPARVWLPSAWRKGLGYPGRETPVVTASMCWGSAFATDGASRALFYTMGDVDIF